MLNGILLLDKPAGFTSHDAVAKLRGILHQKKIGHAGTLDPMATGVLVILLGNATRASDHASGQSKEYHARLRLGLTTDTQDIAGKVLSRSPAAVPSEQLALALAAFTGKIDQLPPMYSAVQVGGRRLYDLARKGLEIERQSREISIEEMCLLPSPDLPEGDYDLKVICSKGTYIRTLCHDIGQFLGCGGCMAALRRVRSGQFSLDRAMTLEQISDSFREGTLEDRIFPTESVFSDLPAVFLNEEGDLRASHGAFFAPSHLVRGTFPEEGGCCRVYDSSGRFCQIAQAGKLDRGDAALFCKINFAALGRKEEG